MIYTVTLNPALDRTISINQIQCDKSNRIAREQNYAGGKGIDVSKVLTALETANRALGFVGGFAGEEMEGKLINDGVQCDFIRVSQETRTNIIINDIGKKYQTIFIANGPEIKPYELMQLIYKLEKLEDPGIVVVSGSLPPGVHPEIYRKIIEIVKINGASVVLDSHGDGLRKGIEARPRIIKPNIHELSQLQDKKLEQIEDIITAAQKIRRQGVEIVLVSLGHEGIMMVTEKEKYLASPPAVDVVNTIGAGDSAVAGFVYGLSNEKPLKECLTYAVAAGTATTLRPGTALCREEDVLELIPKIKLKNI